MRHHYTEDEAYDLRREFLPRRRKNMCSDGFCGADDCDRCHPEGEQEEESEDKP